MLVTQQAGLDEVDDGGGFIVVELVMGLEVEPQVGAVGTALILIEDQSVRLFVVRCFVRAPAVSAPYSSTGLRQPYARYAGRR